MYSMRQWRCRMLSGCSPKTLIRAFILYFILSSGNSKPYIWDYYTVEPLWKGQECLTKVAKFAIFMHHSLQIMFILPLMTGHLFWKATILGGLYRGVSLYSSLSLCQETIVSTMNFDMQEITRTSTAGPLYKDQEKVLPNHFAGSVFTNVVYFTPHERPPRIWDHSERRFLFHPSWETTSYLRPSWEAFFYITLLERPPRIWYHSERWPF